MLGTFDIGQTIKAMLASATLQLLGVDSTTAIAFTDTWLTGSNSRIIEISDYSVQPLLPLTRPSTIEVVHIESLDWQEVMTSMIQTGKASPAELMQFALQHSERAAPGRKKLPTSEVEIICLDYERNGHRYRTQEAFASKHNISVASFKRYWRQWKLIKKSI